MCIATGMSHRSLAAFPLRHAVVFAAFAVLASAAACASPPDDSASTSAALSSTYTLVVGGETTPTTSNSGDAAPSTSDAGPGGDADELDEPATEDRASGDGAKVRATRMLSRVPRCVLDRGSYALADKPQRSADGTFWHVTFKSAPTGIGGQYCGPSGWVEASVVRFEQATVADAPPAPSPPTTRGESCAADASFRPRFLAPRRGPGTGRFGDCRDGCSRRHAGVDVAASTGTKILAPEDGTVIDARTGAGACGTVLEIRHPNGSSTRFCHSSRLLVRKGDCVRRGEAIAEVGNTGIGTGPHMHLEFFPTPTGGAINPASIFGY